MPDSKKSSKIQALQDSFAEAAARLGGQIHLRSMRDAFATIIPIFVLGGIAVLVNNVVLPLFVSGDMLEEWQAWGTQVSTATMNAATLLIAPVVGYCLARNRNFENPLSAAVIASCSLLALMPATVSVTAVEGGTVSVIGALAQSNIGTNGLFTGIFAGLVSTELFIRLSNVNRLRINLGEGVPPMVSKSFSVLIPLMMVLALFGGVSALLANVWHTDMTALISYWIQTPLKAVGTSLPGILLLYGLAQFLFTIGIHQSVITDTLLTPILIVAINENMSAFAAGEAIPNIITNNTTACFGSYGGSGCTLALIIATFLFSKRKVSKQVAAMALAPGLFNINEPVVYGYPVVFNLPLMIPFVLCPLLDIVLMYVATALGLIGPAIAMVPWTTPPLISGFLSSGGDIRTVIFQALAIALDVIIYLPFLKIHERVMEREAQAEKGIA